MLSAIIYSGGNKGRDVKRMNQGPRERSQDTTQSQEWDRGDVSTAIRESAKSLMSWHGRERVLSGLVNTSRSTLGRKRGEYSSEQDDQALSLTGRETQQ
ncbi:hypothetical protein RRG08_005728 [Elysia crispata]|uniref:Uncharacterized protein n=1 Tax=Elysia crispata TaxID=231223 RepID=A0AAE0YCX3_9GAST|nr:hypothetical protein RRG08_005728 [Elysia crispata]